MAWTVTRATKESAVITGDAIDASGLNSSSSFRIGRFAKADIQMTHASHSDTSTWEVQFTNDGTNWITHAGSSKTTSGASGSDALTLDGISGDLIRVTVTETDANAGATLTPVIKFLEN